MAGFNLPPGVSPGMIPGEGDSVCDICGQEAGACVCPDCPKCNAQGDPNCYAVHGMTLNKAQLVERQKIRVAKLQADVDGARSILTWLQDHYSPFMDFEDQYPEADVVLSRSPSLWD